MTERQHGASLFNSVIASSDKLVKTGADEEIERVMWVSEQDDMEEKQIVWTSGR